jgi:response regulator RpfG family c-di-GMP phosphodiesterase
VAKGIIVKDAGSHFDPAVVEAFIAAEAAFVDVREQYHEAVTAAA